MTEEALGRKGMEELKGEMADMIPLSFRKIDDAKKLAYHFQCLMQHPAAQAKPQIQRYLAALNDQHLRSYTQKREGVEVDYIYPSDSKNNQQRQRFNSLSVTEVSELLRMEFANSEQSRKVHICTECNVEIETNEEEPLMESLQRHFNLEVHQPRKVEPVDVSEPIVLPNLSRRMSSMVERGEAIAPAQLQHLEQIAKDYLNISKHEKLDRLFSAKLETFLVRNLPDNTEPSINAAVRLYQSIFENLTQDMLNVDFSALTSSVAPIIMSIKDNVNQNFAADANKTLDSEENEQGQDKPAKNQTKKYRYYGPIESAICKLLTNHKLLTLVDDRTGKPAFFCMACEYYTLRFRYDSVLNHVFSETHVHNLSQILESDERITFHLKEKSTERIQELNEKFLLTHSVAQNNEGIGCGLCKVNIDSVEASVLHILDENHLAKLSDKIYRKARAASPDGPIPDEWGPKNLDWAKYLTSTGKLLTNKDTVVIENFIKPSGKVANYCSSCDMTLKGPRQVLFNHVRQKKHLRNVAPNKLQLLYKNHCRPVEYYASFGNYYTCAICADTSALPSFSAAVDHIESDGHIQTISLLLKFALHFNEAEFSDLMVANRIAFTSDPVPFKCGLCDARFANSREVATHVLSSLQHQNATVDARHRANRGDIISAYMKGNYILHSEGATFTCVVCNGVFGSVRSLLMHLVYAEHFDSRPTAENVFRFYLELKHNIGLLARNKYTYLEFGRLRCGACDGYLEEEENAKRHVVSARHRESMGVGYHPAPEVVAAE